MRNVEKKNMIVRKYANGRGFYIIFKNAEGRKYKWNSSSQALKRPNGSISSARMSDIFMKKERRNIRRKLPLKRSENLTTQVKYSHAKGIERMLKNTNKTVIYSPRRPTSPMNKIPTKYLPVKRVGGSTRTADGAAFLLRDERYIGKIVYYSSEKQLKDVLREYEIGKKMGEIGVGPMVKEYFMIESASRNVPRNLLRNGGVGRKALYIIMENLAYGAADLLSYYEYFKKRNMSIVNKLAPLVRKMRNYDIVHGDMHMENILVKVFKNGHVRVYIIDYGRSAYVPSTISNRNIARYLKNQLMHKTVSNRSNYLESPGETYRAPHPLTYIPRVSPKNNNVNIPSSFFNANRNTTKSHPISRSPKPKRQRLI